MSCRFFFISGISYGLSDPEASSHRRCEETSQLANYYCPQEADEAKRRQGYCAPRTILWLARDVGGYRTRWKVEFGSRILWLSSLANAWSLEERSTGGHRVVGVPGRPETQRPREAFVVSCRIIVNH